MESPQMRKWIYHRAKEILDAIDDIPYSDDATSKKLAVIRKGLRDASVELFRRAAERTARELLDSEELKEINSEPAKIRKIQLD